MGNTLEFTANLLTCSVSVESTRYDSGLKETVCRIRHGDDDVTLPLSCLGSLLLGLRRIEGVASTLPTTLDNAVRAMGIEIADEAKGGDLRACGSTEKIMLQHMMRGHYIRSRPSALECWFTGSQGERQYQSWSAFQNLKSRGLIESVNEVVREITDYRISKAGRVWLIAQETDDRESVDPSVWGHLTQPEQAMLYQVGLGPSRVLYTSEGRHQCWFTDAEGGRHFGEWSAWTHLVVHELIETDLPIVNDDGIVFYGISDVGRAVLAARGLA